MTTPFEEGLDHGTTVRLVLRIIATVDTVLTVLGFLILVGSNGGPGMTGPALIELLIGLTAGALLFGCGEVIGMVGRIAANSDRMRVLVEQGDARSQGTRAAIERIASQTRLLAGAGNVSAKPVTDRPTPPPAPKPPGNPMVRRFFYLGVDDQMAGPVPEARLRQLFEAGTVGEESQVCQEGGEEWKPLTETVLL